MNKSIGLLSIIVAVCLCSGCVVGLREIDISKIHAKAFDGAMAGVPAGSDRLRVSISVVDKREFKEYDYNPSIPSVGDGGEKWGEACLIGRQFNGFGMPMGAVSTCNGYTVAEYMKKMVAEAFVKAGCEIVQEASPGDGVVLVQVEINQFWGWFSPGAWSLTMHVNSDLRLAICQTEKCNEVSSFVSTRESAQAATSGVWLAGYTKNADELVQDLTDKIKHVIVQL